MEMPAVVLQRHIGMIMQARFKPGKYEAPREDEAEALEAELGPLANATLR